MAAREPSIREAQGCMDAGTLFTCIGHRALWKVAPSRGETGLVVGRSTVSTNPCSKGESKKREKEVAMKRFAMILLATATLFGGIGMASAQGHGGGHMGGSGGFHGGTAGAWQGGGNWSGGNWHGGSSWNGGSWHHDGHNRVFVGVGLGWPWWGWGWGWWPGYYYPYYPAYGYPYYDYPYGDYSGGYIEQGSSGEAQPAPAPRSEEHTSE